MRSITKKALIVVLALGLAACAPEAAPTESPLPMESVTIEETAAPTATPAKTTEAQALTPLCEISEGMLNENLAAFGTVAFVDQNPEGMFAEIEDNGCNIGAFVPGEVYANWDMETQELLETGQTLEAQGVLISFDGRLILDLSEIRPAASADASDPTQVAESTTDESEAASLPEAPETALLEVPLVYSGSHNLPGLCYLGAAGMLVKYEHPDLDFADVVALSGMGSSALHLNFPEMPAMLISPYKEQSIVFMIQNLSGAFVLGLQKSGTASDPFQPASLPFEEHAVQVIEFNNPAEALEILKQIVGSGKPAVVHLNLYHVYDDFAADSEYWRESASKDHASHYMVVKGYDQDWIYLNDPTDPTPSAGALKAGFENFMKAWEDTTTIPNSPPRGPFWMIYLANSGEIPNFEFVIERNLQEAVNAPGEIRSFSERPDSSEFTRFLLLELGNARKHFGEYLARNGQVEAGEGYLHSGELLTTMAVEDDIQTSLLVEVAAVEEGAVEILSMQP